MKSAKSFNCRPRFVSEASSITIAKSRAPRSPLAGTHSLTFSRVLPSNTCTSSRLTAGGGPKFLPKTVVTVRTGTVADGFSCWADAPKTTRNKIAVAKSVSLRSIVISYKAPNTHSKSHSMRRNYKDLRLYWLHGPVSGESGLVNSRRNQQERNLGG